LRRRCFGLRKAEAKSLHTTPAKARRLCHRARQTSVAQTIEEPTLDVYVVSEKTVKTMSMEEYLQGVLAGEMQSDWPLEALKAQAIIARTFAMKFLEDKGKSKYEGADISTDIEEAQAYNAEGYDQSSRPLKKRGRGDTTTASSLHLLLARRRKTLLP
jgi:peptidoglycan hydrolase-like amidase